jgi:hypothetical protein
MKAALAYVALALVASMQFHQVAAVTPVQKVLQMMNEMKAKGDAMKAEEAKTYATYKEWFDDTTRQLGFDLKTANSDIEAYTAAATKADSDVAQLTNAIAKLNAELQETENEKAEATKIRNEQNAEYLSISTDYSESVDALQRAIQVMQSRNYNVPEAEAFLQKFAVEKPGIRRVLAAFIQETQKGSGAPSVNAYEFQSDSIVALLEKFLKKFSSELEQVETEERNQVNNYDNEMIQLSHTIDYLKKELEEKSVLKAKRSKESAQAKADLASTKHEKAEDEKTLAEMKATFAAKTDQFNENQEVRANELEAIAKAIEIISSPAVAQSYSEHINLAQLKTSFLQTRSARSRVSARQNVVAFLERKAALLSSQNLKALAKQAESNPFDKVITLIEDLLAKLKEEAAAEAEHKAWCDEQLHDNKIKREKKTAKVNKLTAEIESLTEDIASMAKQIQILKEEQAALTLAMSKATTQRETEKAANTDAMKDAAAGEAATKAATVILREFYASQASLLQQVPEMAAYKGMHNAKTGVVGMLEVISSDFARLYADTKAAEDAAAKEYKAFMKDASTSNKAKHDLEFQTSLKMDQTQYDKETTQKDMDATQVELDRALDYQQYLKPMCLEVHVTYEERVKRRQEEIKALQEAYDILAQKA